MPSRECGPLTRVEAPTAVSCGMKKNGITFSCKTYGNETSTTQRTDEGGLHFFSFELGAVHLVCHAVLG